MTTFSNTINFFGTDYQSDVQPKTVVPFKPDDEPLFKDFFKKSAQSFDTNPFGKYACSKVVVPKVGNQAEPFDKRTMSLMYKIPHKTKLLDVAQNHLGIQEVTEAEYKNLSYAERLNTQMHLIGEYGTLNHQWCAHTVSHISEESGMDIGGHKKAVQEFIDWAKEKGTYNPIKENNITSSNYISERRLREAQIKEQFGHMHEGDYIIWKSDFVADVGNGELVQKKASHIGFIESVNSDGTVTVIEGNANEFYKLNSEREVVTTPVDGKRGNQEIGEFREVNNRDGLIRKVYTAKELAAFGYSGYIDNSKIVK